MPLNRAWAGASLALLLLVWLGFFNVASLLALLPEPIGSRAELFGSGARITLYLTLLAFALGLPLGIVAGIGRRAKYRWLRATVAFYLWIFRGTPLLIQIFFVYYAVPGLFPAVPINEFWAAAIALGLNVGAYNAGAMEGGLLAVPHAQDEAAFCLGLSPWQRFRFVVFPQALRVATPALINNFVALLKDSSIASAIGLVELTLIGNRVSSETFQPVPVILVVSLLYLLLTTATTLPLWLRKRGLP